MNGKCLFINDFSCKSNNRKCFTHFQDHNQTPKKKSNFQIKKKKKNLKKAILYKKIVCLNK